MEKKIQLAAVNAQGKKVNSCNCQERVEFVNLRQEMIVTEYENGAGVVIKTAKGEYQLAKHATMNSYHGQCGGFRVRVTLKKMVGTLSYWVS